MGESTTNGKNHAKSGHHRTHIPVEGYKIEDLRKLDLKLLKQENFFVRKQKKTVL